VKGWKLDQVWPLKQPDLRSPYQWLCLLACAAVLPNLIWISLDRAAWPWDQAWYGKHSVELFFTLAYSPSQWLPAMLNLLGRMAPGIAWIGQFFVPVGLAVGSIDTGLLFSIVLAQVMALLLTVTAVWDLSDRTFGAAITALVVMASAPLFIALSHYYLAEMMQTTAVAWFVLIMARAPAWSRLRTGSQLVLATSFAMLAKVSSPLYCFAPGLVALYYFVRSNSRDTSQGRPVATLALSILVAAATVAWYYQNFRTVVAHVSMSASGSVAELYGKQEPFLLSLKYWLSALQVGFFSRPTAILAAGSLVLAVGTSIAWPRIRAGRFALATALAALEIAVVLGVFSWHANRDNRYLLPLLPYVVLILSWAVYRLDRWFVTFAIVTAFWFQWGYLHAQSLGLRDGGAGAAPWLVPITSDTRHRALLDALVARTCADPGSGLSWNAVGVQLPWLNAPGVSYAAAKALAPRYALNCDFAAIGYYDSDAERAWSQLMSIRIAYYIAVDSTVFPTQSTSLDSTLNQLNAPTLKRIESSGLFQRERGIDGHEGILIFRRVDRVDHVASGRALSDQGRHQQAIDELNIAARLDPHNVEAWANLALAYERAGDFPQAVSAGIRARSLDAGHYYVNLGLARAFMQQGEWTHAAGRAEDAAAHAPDPQHRVDALVMAAKAAFQIPDSRKGCTLLRRAEALPAGRLILDEGARHACGELSR
jgi:tetratricopeptide (TPR) repeat protein